VRYKLKAHIDYRLFQILEEDTTTEGWWEMLAELGASEKEEKEAKEYMKKLADKFRVRALVYGVGK
jgi:hypothetical protein